MRSVIMNLITEDVVQMDQKEMIREICNEELFIKIKSRYNLTDTDTKWLIRKVFEYFKSEVIEKEFNEEKLTAKDKWRKEKWNSKGKHVPSFSEYFKIGYSYLPTFEGYFIHYLVQVKEQFEKEILEYIEISDYFGEDEDEEEYEDGDEYDENGWENDYF